MQKGKKFLSDLKLYSDYFKWKEDEGRYETWEEAVDSIIGGHKEKYNDKLEQLQPYFDSMRESMVSKTVLASQRNLQFRYPQVKKSNARLYNCSSMHCVRNRVFQEVFFLGLNGAGVGISLLLPFVSKLSKIEKRNNGTKTYVVPDSIDGWADALGVLMSSYFVDEQPFPEYAGYKIRFDYSLIRPKGSQISGGFKAPGPEGLQHSLEKIEKLLDSWIEKEGNTIRPILAFDIFCHSADSVLSGSVRRCLQGTDDVITDKGLVKLKDIKVGDKVLTHDGTFNSVIEKENNGVRKVTKITTNLGEYYSTNNHEWLIAKDVDGNFEGRLCQDLQIGDVLMLNNKEHYGTYQEFSVFDGIDYTPPKLDEETAWLFGYFLGNGSVSVRTRTDEKLKGNLDSKFRICCPSNYPTIVKKVEANFVKFVETYSTHNKGTSIEFTCSKNAIAEYFLNFKQPNTEIRIPDFIKQNSIEIQRAFIAGLLDSDGSVRNEVTEDGIGTGQITVCSSKYKNFIDEIYSLCNYVGLITRTVTKIRENKGNEYLLKTVSSTYRNKFIGDVGKYSEKIKTDYSVRESDIERYGIVYPKTLSKKRGEIHNIWKNRKVATLERIVSHYSNLNYIPAIITEIEYDVFEEEVYDIEVENNHNFYIKGALTHNSALNMIVDPNDKEMIFAKVGNWRAENPQRARSNNSVLLRRKDVTKEQFEAIVRLNDGDSDIGFAFVNSFMDVYNPCFSGEMKILLEDGYKQFCELEENKIYKFVTPLGDVVDGYVKQSGIKHTVNVKLSNKKVLKVTPDHLFMTLDGEECKAEDLLGKQLNFFSNPWFNFDTDYVKFGFLQGDGGLGRLKSEGHKGLEIFLNEKDFEIAKLFNIPVEQRTYINGYNEDLTSLKFSSEKLPNRALPESIEQWNDIQIKSFLRGLYSANGSFIKVGRIALKSTCRKLVEQVSELLLKTGIKSYITTNKPKNVKFSNGTYLCKESYDLNIANYEGICSFNSNIGFVQSYKTENVLNYLKEKSPKVISIKKNKGYDVVYDFELNDMIHYGVVEGIAAHNCFEISKLPILTEENLSEIDYDQLDDFVEKNKGNFGVAFCNLTEINAENCLTKEKFLKACKDASIIGTLQAGYTEFPYLGEVTEKIVRREALLGVSVTGWMNNPKLFDAELLKEGANLVKSVNKEVAAIIGINPAARTTTCKPSGNASVILGTASGIHPEHSERYFRIMQLNKDSNTAKWLKENMEFLLEESVWSATNSDYVVFVPVENPKAGLFKKDMKGIKHLELIKLVQENWVREGTNDDLCLYKGISHNVSNTVIIDNKQEMIDYIYEHRNLFNAVSFLSDYGDKDFNQAPFTSVLTFEELVEQYGKAAIFASGLIVDGLHYFDNNLWLACDLVLDIEERNPIIGTREQVMLRKYWIKRAKKFARNYFKGDLKKMVYCLKDIHLFHKWDNINRQFRDVDFSKILSKPQFKDISDYGAVACSGGMCEVTKI